MAVTNTRFIKHRTHTHIRFRITRTRAIQDRDGATREKHQRWLGTIKKRIIKRTASNHTRRKNVLLFDSGRSARPEILNLVRVLQPTQFTVIVHRF